MFYGWNKNVWLPRNISWGEIENGPDKNIVYASYRDLWYLVPLVLLVLVQRYLFEKYIFKPIALYLNIKQCKRRNAPHIPVLEEYFKKSRKFTNVYTISKQIDISERQIERWWRLRRNQAKPSKIDKFCESMWRGTFYMTDIILGLYSLWDKEWVWDVDKCFIGYPHQGITADIWWYYMISSAFYWSLTISQFWDVRRKDFWQMFVHHIATIALLSFSWVLNFHRVGSLILILHDSSDMFLEFAKAFRCAGIKRVANINFVIFISLWYTMRMYIFPAYVMTTTFKHPFETIIIKLVIIFLCLIMVMNLNWSWIIFKMVVKTLNRGEFIDVRSSNSEDEELNSYAKEKHSEKTYTLKETRPI